MGNRTFQLPQDYKPVFEFPNIMVVLNDEVPVFGQRVTVTQNLAGYNIDQIPVLYDITTENILYVQEEIVNIPITATVNCESSFQAKEVANVVRRWLPINKFIQFLEYTSFLEVSEQFLSRSNFNINSDQIVNLYTKLNHRTGQVVDCFSILYKPFIRLDSISAPVPDSTQRSYQVTVDMTWMVQFPLHLYNDKMPGTIEKIDISIVNTSGFEPISDWPSSKIINHTSSDLINLKKGYIRRNFVVYDDFNSADHVLTDDTLVVPADSIIAKSTILTTTKSADDRLLIGVDDSETRYKIAIDDVPVAPDSTNIDISNSDRFLVLSKNLAGDISIYLHRSTRDLVVKFDPSDFTITEDYSYNLFSGTIIIKDYQNYTLDLIHNQVSFSFSASDWLRLKPTITHPLIIQFYNKEGVFPFQFGGVPPKFANVKAIPKSTTALITWTSGEPTTTQVEYGLTTEYGNFTELKEDLAHTHQSILYNLNTFTTYHYRINTTDENNNEYISEDYSFTTNP
jgi:hypothetical protein